MDSPFSDFFLAQLRGGSRSDATLNCYLTGLLEKRRHWKQWLKGPASGSKASDSLSRLVNVKDFAQFSA
jgi:hypothetical protein